MLIILFGPKGSGKTHIGRLLESEFGVHFFHVEPLWMTYYAECAIEEREPKIKEGVSKIDPVLRQAIEAHEHVCVETTGGSQEIVQHLLSIKPPEDTLLARIHAPLERCLDRISNRDPSNQIPMDVDDIAHIYRLYESLDLTADLQLNNVELTTAEILDEFAPLLIKNSKTGR